MMPKGQAKLWRLITLDKAYNEEDDEDAENIKIEHAQMIIALIDASQAAALLAWRGLVSCGRTFRQTKKWIHGWMMLFILSG